MLSLANTDWPISEAEANENIPLYCGEEPGDIKPHGAAANLHRIKALLGRGKVVVSEVTMVLFRKRLVKTQDHYC